MLEINIPERDQWDEVNEVFIKTESQTIRLEHSLLSLSKWESKWHKYFLENKDITNEELLDYIRCMTLTQNVDPNVYYNLTEENLKAVNEYIHNPMTATWFREVNNRPPSRSIITSEVIYSWMVALQIPFECEKWHLNRLMVLIRVCNENNQPKKKMNRRDVMNRNKALNEMRKQAYNTSG